MLVLSGIRRAVCTHFNPKCSYSTYQHEKQRDFLSKFKGGSVRVDKNATSGIATVTLDHVERKNAFSGDMMVQLSDVVSELEQWSEGKGLLLHGADGSFCSGGDLTFMTAIAESVKGQEMSTFMQDVLCRLANLPLVSVAVVEGRALGGGAELATACDFRLMEKSARIGWVQCRMGVSPGWGGGVKLVEILGRTKALDLLTRAVVLKADEAVEIGLASQVLSTGDCLNEAHTWLSERTRWSQQVVQAAKRVVVNACVSERSQVLEGERRIFGTVWGGEAQLEAIGGNIKHN